MHRHTWTNWIARAGVYAFAIGSVAAGVMDLIWGDFDPAHQPIQALGDHIPGREVLAYVTGVWMIVGGAAIVWRRSARIGGAMLAASYFIFAVFWLPRFYTAPHALGFRISLMIGLLAGAGTQLIAGTAAALVYAPRTHRLAKWTFGLCAIAFGLQHLTNISANVIFVPAWLPLGGAFWTIVTGNCFILAGLAILSESQDLLAARLLGLMFLVFNVVSLPSFIVAHPESHAAWGGNAFNLAAVGAAWILAESIAGRRAASAAPGL